jgi:rhamnose utilization protein RhaD (predicted bifunctional aldolase and dehydrogenase)
MLNKFVVTAVVMMAICVSSAAKAEEKLMILWPKQRAAHQIVMDDHTAAYKARGQAYVDHLYDTGGEEPMPAADDLSMGGEIEPVPINVGQVAEMVKATEAKSKVAPDAQTAATPH